MKRLAGTLALVGAGLVAGGAWGAMPSPIATSATVALSSTHAGARPVAITLKLQYEMQCGYPGAGPVDVKLPTQMQVPVRIPSGSVLLDGKPVAATLVGPKEFSVTVAPHTGVMCDVIGPGTLTLAVTKAASFGNPKKPGTYAVAVQHGAQAFRATVRITAT